MKFWLIIFFMTPQGEYIGKREIAYADEALCYLAMDHIKPSKKMVIEQMVCVSDDHHSGRKQDPGVDYD